MDETVGQRIERIALAKGLPDGAALAALLGVKYETLRRWRKNLAAPNKTQQGVIEGILGVPAGQFMHAPTGNVATAGPGPQLQLSAMERRLIEAFRSVVQRQRIDALAALESQARDVNEIKASAIAEMKSEAAALAPAPAPSPATRQPAAPAGSTVDSQKQLLTSLTRLNTKRPEPMKQAVRAASVLKGPVRKKAARE